MIRLERKGLYVEIRGAKHHGGKPVPILNGLVVSGLTGSSLRFGKSLPLPEAGLQSMNLKRNANDTQSMKDCNCRSQNQIEADESSSDTTRPRECLSQLIYAFSNTAGTSGIFLGRCLPGTKDCQHKGASRSDRGKLNGGGARRSNLTVLGATWALPFTTSIAYANALNALGSAVDQPSVPGVMIS